MSASGKAEARRPAVLLPACNKALRSHPFHIIGRKYVDAVRLAGCMPLVVPNAGDSDLDALLELADGVLLTGSPSNVDPAHFGEDVHDGSLPLDPERDAWTLPFVRKALQRGLPVFGICRGAQEANVALGGSLHQAVHEVEGFADHRDDDDAPVEVQYGAAHDAVVEPGGVLERLLGLHDFKVNSLHGQAVKRLAAGVRVEARAPDGVVEAFSVPYGKGFNLFVQWHPEWEAAENPVSMRMLRAFGDACRAYRAGRNLPSADRIEGHDERAAALTQSL